jgi:glycosyltransferase involved in cell wall biosynthesis
MRVLHLSESDISGGASKYAYALHDGLRRHGETSRMLVGRRFSDDPDVRTVKRHNGWRAADRVAGTVQRRLSIQDAFLPSSFGVRRDKWFRDSDVLQVHNLHGSWFGYAALRSLTRRVPGVWLLHDMWSMTGHAAFTYDCERWTHGCGSCPYPNEYPRLGRDRTALNWRLKKQLYAGSRLTIVVSSGAADRKVARSPLLSAFPRRTIPLGIDIDRFSPGVRDGARERLGIAGAGPLVLCLDGEERKGSSLLPAILAEAAALGATGSVAVAGGNTGWSVPAGWEFTDLGRITDEARLADAYAAADVFLFPTRDDWFPNSVLESLASGTPVVGTTAGGVPEQVRDGKEGLIAPVGAVSALAAALSKLVMDAELRERFSVAARRRAVKEYSVEREIDRFRALYAEVTAR